jgi:hypothetical protein
MAAAQVRQRRDVGGLHQRIGRHFRDEARNLAGPRGKESLQRLQVEHIALVVITRTDRELFQDRDRIEVKPAELHPLRPAARRLHRGHGPEGAVDRVHAIGRKKQIVVASRRQGALHDPDDFRVAVAGEVGFRVRFRAQPALHQLVFGLPGGDKAAQVLQIEFGELGDLRVGDVGHAVRALVGEGDRLRRRTVLLEVSGERLRHPPRGHQP